MKEGKIRPTLERWQALTTKIQAILSGLVCLVMQYISLIVYSQQLAGLNNQDSINTVRSGVHGHAVHIPHRSTHSNRKTSPPILAPYKAHLKNNWRVPESLEKVITIPRSLHPHLKW